MRTIEEYYRSELKCDRCGKIFGYFHDPPSEDIVCAGCVVYHGKEEMKE
jgi:hypothetical protein